MLAPMIVLFFFGCLVIPLAIAAQVFWICMIVSVAKNEELKDNDKLMWVLIVVLANWIGALIYFFVARPHRSTPT